MLPKDWKTLCLSDIANISSGGTPSRDTHSYWNGDIPWVRTTEVQNCYLHPEDIQEYISQHGLENSSAKIVAANSILLAMIGQGKTRGQVALLRLDAATNQNCAAITLNEDQCPEFHFQQLLSKYQSIRDLSNSAGQSNLSGALVKSIEVIVPPLREQTKIAQILSTWDKAIAITELLLANSQQQKNMLTNQLLNGQKRFSEFVTSQDYQRTSHGSIPSDWGYVSIAEIANQQSKVNSTQSELPVLSCSKYDGLVDSLKYFKKKVYSDDTSKYRVVELGDFAYPSNHIEEGSIGYQDLYPAGIVSPIYTVFRTSDAVDDYFLYRTLKTDKYRQIFSAATSASVDRRGSLRWKEFSKIQVPLPPLPEQQKIAQVLSTTDAEIANLQAQLDKLKLEKKALMQQLLTGKRRVRLDDEEEYLAPIRRVG